MPVSRRRRRGGIPGTAARHAPRPRPMPRPLRMRAATDRTGQHPYFLEIEHT
ncbi:hypothetical protein ACIQWL_39485 [Streptomyces mirabilis]|uniref:hypothetical protein n=1 Tax=Streptomyces mirabilis TaxID=68239 RepID=UPI00380EFB75